MKGEISQKLESCANLPVVVFLPIEDNLPHLENKNDLSIDQKYLMDMCIEESLYLKNLLIFFSRIGGSLFKYCIK